MAIQEWLSQGKYFSYKQFQLFYRTFGKNDKPALLLLHGFPTASFDWYKIVDALSVHFNVICFDMIGYGFSDKPLDYDYSLFDQADIAEKLLQFLQTKECHILAHDKGDTVANELIARQNENKLSFNIFSCCLLNGGLFPGIHKPRPVQWALMTPFGKFLTPFYTKWMLTKTFNRIYGKVKPTKDEMNDFWFLLNYNNGRKIFHKLIWYMQERTDNESRWLTALQETKIPLRLIDGEDDPISGKHMGEHYEKVIPKPDVVYLKDIGHYPNIEAADEVLTHFLAFHQVKYP
ncbi:MAG: alpha/beta fold hydrolase [Chitinophagales bacterium]